MVFAYSEYPNLACPSSSCHWRAYQRLRLRCPSWLLCPYSTGTCYGGLGDACHIGEAPYPYLPYPRPGSSISAGLGSSLRACFRLLAFLWRSCSLGHWNGWITLFTSTESRP